MKLTAEEYVQTLADLDVLGKIKYLLDQDELHTRALNKLIMQEQAHHEAHQALMEARDARERTRIESHERDHQGTNEAKEAGKCKK